MRNNVASVVLLLASVACGGGAADSAAGSGQDTATSSGSTAPAATSAPSPQSAAPSTTPPATTAPAIRVGIGRADQLGTYLVDGNGRALYLLEEDGRGGRSTCYEMCAAIWPPFLAGQAAPTPADSSVRSSLLGSAPRQGGGAQVTYNGYPLYYYLGDARPGQTRGHHVEDSWGEWYLVSPSGRHVGEGGERGGGRGRRGRGRDDGR